MKKGKDGIRQNRHHHSSLEQASVTEPPLQFGAEVLPDEQPSLFDHVDSNDEPSRFGAEELPDENLPPPLFDNISNEKGQIAAANNSINDNEALLRDSSSTLPGAVAMPGTYDGSSSFNRETAAIVATQDDPVAPLLRDSSSTFPGAVAVPGADAVNDTTDAPADDNDDVLENTSGLAVAQVVVEDDEEQDSIIMDGRNANDDEERPVDPTSLAMAQPVDVSKTKWLQSRQNRLLLLLGLVLVLVIIVVGVVFGTRNNTGGTNTNETTAPSSAPTSQRFGRAFDIASLFTAQDVLLDPTTPQYTALAWLVEEDELELDSNDARVLQRYALATFYFATNGTSWTRTADFVSPTMDECEWGRALNDEGVRSCNADGLVTELRFHENNNLTGTIPREIGALVAIKSITLRFGSFGGTLSDFLSLQNMTELWIQATRLGGKIPDELGGLTKLSSLVLTANKLTGTIPPTLGNLTALQELYLGNNDLTGTLPPELSKLDLVKVLHTNSNRLDGTIPLEFAVGLSSLTDFRVNGNSFIGPVDHICNNTRALLTFTADCYTNSILSSNGEPTELPCPCCTACCTDEPVLNSDAGECFRCAASSTFCG